MKPTVKWKKWNLADTGLEIPFGLTELLLLVTIDSTDLHHIFELGCHLFPGRCQVLAVPTPGGIEF